MLIFNYGVIAGFALVLLIKVWRACRRNKSGKQKEEKSGGQKDKVNEQDHNGIHVEMVDQDDGEDDGQTKEDPESGSKLKNKESQNNKKASSEEKEAKK